MPTGARYTAPATSPPLEVLDVLRVGLSLDVYRQGQAWDALRRQDAAQPNALGLLSILPTGPGGYPVTAYAKDMAYDKRKSDALRLALRDFLEGWPIPTVTVVRGWDPDAPDPSLTPAQTRKMLSGMVDRLRDPAGLHGHQIRQLERGGIVCDDTPEGVVEHLFRLFEANPDLPAVLVYSVDGFNMAATLGTRGNQPIGVGNGPRQPGELTDSMVAIVVGRSERLNWLREYARLTKSTAGPVDPPYPGCHGRGTFVPSPFVPQPWTERTLTQWDALPVLARVHRPVTAPLRDAGGRRLRNDALTAARALAWRQATQGLSADPARVFYDGGHDGHGALTDWTPALRAAHSSVDLLASNQSYDLTRRLGDTGSASPFVGLALATIASCLNADTSMVAALRRTDQATLIAVSSPTPGTPPGVDPFGLQHAPTQKNAARP
ncbi:hypothetical protein D3C71_205180 [compost metagenome]